VGSKPGGIHNDVKNVAGVNVTEMGITCGGYYNILCYNL